MMNIHKIRTAGTIFAVLLVGTLAVRAGLLDGIKSKVKVTPDPTSTARNEKPFDDTLSFANGRFSSKTFLAKGFAPAKYNGDKEENEAEFEVEQTGTNGVLNWQGEIRGSNVLGRLTWTRKNSPPFTYNFQGLKQ
jgi:hypothetical protein